MKIASRSLSLLLVAVMLCAFVSVSAFAAKDSTCAVIGANLSEDEIAEVYTMFGVPRGSVQELTVTNAEERAYLSGKISDSTIGTNSISCVYIEILPEGEGLHITCRNINWCTEAVYENALVTAGIYDANVIIAAPFAVSGTAALTGIYKAYEDVTGKELDETAKDTAVDELLVTSDLAEEFGSADASMLVNELKGILDETQNMTDEELRAEILDIASQLGIELDDARIDDLVALVRRLEKLDSSALIEKVQEAQEAVRKVRDAAEKISEAKEGVSVVVEKVAHFFDSVADFFRNLFGKKG